MNKICPECKEEIKAEATICKYCRNKDFSAIEKALDFSAIEKALEKNPELKKRYRISNLLCLISVSIFLFSCFIVPSKIGISIGILGILISLIVYPKFPDD